MMQACVHAGSTVILIASSVIEIYLQFLLQNTSNNQFQTQIKAIIWSASGVYPYHGL